MLKQADSQTKHTSTTTVSKIYRPGGNKTHKNLKINVILGHCLTEINSKTFKVK
jgi:hypothetical protein